jgi:hypothetical protein
MLLVTSTIFICTSRLESKQRTLSRFLVSSQMRYDLCDYMNRV